MSRGSLSGRLSRIRRMEAARPDPVPADVPHSGVRLLEGWNEIAPFVLERVTRFPVQKLEALSAHLPLLFPRERVTLGQAFPLNQLRFRFFDLETTGLSRGAGTVAFMAGIGEYTPDSGFLITQLLITDYPGEAALLERFASLIQRDSILVSFNGKCFDSQILINRSLMNGLRPAYLSPDTLHLDLLFPSRRLWKHRTESCRMQVLEREILGFYRTDDLPGSEAPDAWFEFLRGEGSERLQAVGKHNCDDVYSLMLLLRALDTEIAFAGGKAGLIRAQELRKTGDYRGAAEILECLADEGLKEAQFLLSIDCEHRLDRLEQAGELARLLGDAHRLERIERKLVIRAGRFSTGRREQSGEPN